METLEEISDDKFHRQIDQLYDYIMANGYRFNTHIGAVLLASLYQQDKQMAYGFVEKWESDGAAMRLSEEEVAHLKFAQDATALKQRLANGTNQGVIKALDSYFWLGNKRNNSGTFK